MLDRAAIVESYFTKEKLVQHQIESYNNFLEYGLQRVIAEQSQIKTDIADTYVKLERIIMESPIVREADGSIELLYPSEARVRNLTYSIPLKLEMSIVDDYEEKDVQVPEIGLLPIMIGSKKCNLSGMNEKELIHYGEDPMDPGGYFIVNGTERVLITLEDLAPNKILVELNKRYGEFIEVAKVFSQQRGYRALVMVEKSRHGILEVSFPSISGRLNFITIIKALGLATDFEIINSVSQNPKISKVIFENLEEADVETNADAIDRLGKRVAAGQAKEYQVKRANFILDRYLLPHLGNDETDRMKKAYFLGRMAEAVLELSLGERNEDDKDHYSNKRLKLAGDLMEDLFRVSFSRLVKDIKYQLERSKMRNRELNMYTAVRADVLTERLNQPLATGNWIGGRTGVSQLLDRTNYMSMLSHLRRVISPLSRSQPHFEARDLHPTQWGRICPSETPEGPNCGLVKNLAQLVELSTGMEDIEPLKKVIFDLETTPL